MTLDELADESNPIGASHDPCARKLLLPRSIIDGEIASTSERLLPGIHIVVNPQGQAVYASITEDGQMTYLEDW